MATQEESNSPSRPTIFDERFQIQKEAAAIIYSKIYEWQTRILLLEPGHFGEPLVAELHVVDLLHGAGVVLNSGQRRRIGYTALSYCWGQPHFTEVLLCNQILYPITKNLSDALQHLRLPNNAIALWVDALCINQHDSEERSMQIANIMTVFSKANEVIAWLGHANSETAHAFQKLHNDESLNDSDVKCVQELVQRPWFRRVWVKQEIFAAQKLFILCGREELSWEKLKYPGLESFIRRGLAMKWQLEAGERTNVYLKPGRDAQDLSVYGSSESLIGNETDIVNVLRRTANSEATDPRDFVYGVLGMSRAILDAPDVQSDVPSLPVDYKKNVSEVFQDVARYVMRRDRCLNVLLLTGKFGQSVNGCRLPSWTPDWRFPTSHESWLAHAADIESRAVIPYVETSHKSGNNPWNKGFSSSNRLDLRGLIIGCIDSDFSNAGGDRIWRLTYAFQTNTIVEKLVGRPRTHTGNLSIWEALRATIDEKLASINADEISQMLREQNDYLEIQLEDFEVEGRRESFPVLLSKKDLVIKRVGRMPAATPWTRHTPDGRGMLEAKKSRGMVPDEHGSLLFPNTKFVNLSVDSDTLQGTQPIQNVCQRILQEDPQEKVTSREKLILSRFSKMSLKLWKPRIWVAPCDAEPGDVVIFVEGGILPLVVRKAAEQSEYQLIGPATLTSRVDLGPVSESDHPEAFSPERLWIRSFPMLPDFFTLWVRLLEIHGKNNQLEKFSLV